jgi:hypothetical protein
VESSICVYTALFYNIGKLFFLYYKNGDCKGRAALAVKGGAQLKRGCVLTPKGDIGPPSGVAEQLFYIAYAISEKR